MNPLNSINSTRQSVFIQKRWPKIPTTFWKKIFIIKISLKSKKRQIINSPNGSLDKIIHESKYFPWE